MPSIAEWVRLALTGEPESATPGDGIITMLETGAKRELAQRFTCLAGAPDSLTTPEEQEDYKEAVGYAIASKIVLLPGGQQFAQFVMTVKVHATTETRQNPAQTAAEAQQVLLTASAAALARLSCVNVASASEPSPSLVELSGRRRGKEKFPCRWY
jgi:hypothetical protein